MDNNMRWFALYTRPRFEVKVYESLKKLGLEAYLPTYKTIRQWSDRKKKIELPLFTSYCFVRIRPEEYYKPMEAYGVVRHIWFNNIPTPIRDEEIVSIRRICEGNYELEVITLDYEFGTPVIIKQGSLQGLQGEYIKRAGKNKLLIRVDAINHGVLVTIDKAFIEIVPKT